MVGNSIAESDLSVAYILPIPDGPNHQSWAIDSTLEIDRHNLVVENGGHVHGQRRTGTRSFNALFGNQQANLLRANLARQVEPDCVGTNREEVSIRALHGHWVGHVDEMNRNRPS